MSEIDLSLLTDEELVNSFQTVSIQAHGAKNDKYVAKFHAIRNELLGRLIAARAENKRKDEALRETLADIDFVAKHGDDLGRRNTLNIIRRRCAALLQSEKESE